MPRHDGTFVPHECCPVASGDCFTQGRCLQRCKSQEKRDQGASIRELERRVLELERLVYAKARVAGNTDPA